MKMMLFLLWILPGIMNAQINRSATEFAKDQIAEYITSKIFKGNDYKPIAYGELKPLKYKESGIAWYITHNFEVTEEHTESHKKIIVKEPHTFTFYLDERMRVVKAESYFAG